MSRHLLRTSILLAAASLALCCVLYAQSDDAPQPADDQQGTNPMRKGKNFIDTPLYSLEDDRRILELFADLRVADVSDGLDQLGLQDKMLVDPAIAPLWKDVEHYSHRIVGIAVTVRYVPDRHPHQGAMDRAAFDHWMGQTYWKITGEPFGELLRAGSVVVIDEAEGQDVGSIGSNNILAWKKAGAVGVVTDGSSRDTDEVAAQRVPLYLRGVGRGVRPGRNMVESVNRPVVIGGVTVIPGDVIVADGDGVVVVPRQYAEAVAAYAKATLDTDKQQRREKYEDLGMELDESVQ